jgi:hypothetical protein
MICWSVGVRVDNLKNNDPSLMEPIPRSADQHQDHKKNGGNVTRNRAADDFPVIRARMEELRRERAQVLVEARGRSAIHPCACHHAANTKPSTKAVSTPHALPPVQS